MLLKCQIHTNTTKNGFLLPTKCLEVVLKYSYIIHKVVKLTNLTKNPQTPIENLK